MEKKEIGTATILNSVNSNTKFLGLEGGELAQIPFNSIPEASTETKGFMGSADKVNINRSTFKNFYNHPNGLLIKTDISENTNAMCSLSIRGMAYNFSLPHDSVYQFYNLSAENVFYFPCGICNGLYMNLQAFIYEGVVCVWIAPEYTKFGLDLYMFSAGHGIVGGASNCYNRIVSGVNVALPTTGIRKLTLIKPKAAYNRISGTLVSYDANSINEDVVITSSIWQNTPESVIGCLEVIKYSTDWIYQRFTKIGQTPVVWQRSFYGGTTWGEWIKI